MITKWATSIANKLAELSGEDVSADQLEIYIYGLECFLNTFITIVLLFVWGVLSHTLGYTLIWVITFSLLRHYTGGAHAPTQLTCILGSFFLGCLDKWAIIYLKPTVGSAKKGFFFAAAKIHNPFFPLFLLSSIQAFNKSDE